MDNGEVDLQAFNFLHQWHQLYKKNPSHYLSIRKDAYDYDFFHVPIVKAFQDLGIIYFHKYNQIVLQSHEINFMLLKAISFLQSGKYNTKLLLEEKFSRWKKLYYSTYYTHFKTFQFSSNYFSMGNRRSRTRYLQIPWEYENNLFVHGVSPKWDIPLELYKGNLSFLSLESNLYGTRIHKF